jgi:glycosyltransferase involved in cell wall biosynthesis
MHKSVLFIIPYPLNESPSQRYRFEQYFHLLEKRGIKYTVQSFLSTRDWRVTFEEGFVLEKAMAVLVGILRRCLSLLRAPFYNFIFIHREALPIGPPIVEWIITKLLRKKVIYDFDDAIWLSDRIDESKILRILKWRAKVKSICRWSYKVSCGNEYLCSFASQFNQRVVYDPTTIDTKSWHNPDLYSRIDPGTTQIVIGWTGSHSTLKYLKEIESVLQEIEREFPNVNFAIIADKRTDLRLNNVSFLDWSVETEIKDLMRFDIGIMPLPNDEWSKGKCGFKALQYMALRIPTVASDVGVNSKIISHTVDGFVCRTADEWKRALSSLIKDPELRKRMGNLGREKVISNYSVVSNSSNFLSLFE